MRKIIPLIVLLVLASCQNMSAQNGYRVSGHIGKSPPVSPQANSGIPPVISQVPVVLAPEPAEKQPTFTIVASRLPANELLFALARDAGLNLDIDPSISDQVSMNAIDQTLPQILKRISRQVSLRYFLDGPNLVVEKDTEFTRVYRIDYLNVSRASTSGVAVSTQIASTGTGDAAGGNSNSSTTITNQSHNDFWESLEANMAMLAGTEDNAGIVISNRESGTVSIRASSSAHHNIQQFLDRVMQSARRQVLIEATVVEVTLSDDFQAGVDWSRITSGEGWSLQQNLLGGTLGTVPFLSAAYTGRHDYHDIAIAIRALDSFGEVSVMSSPKIMALNNQTSVLKVVDNRVYFTTAVEEKDAADSIVAETTFTTTVHTVPVGFVMNVTPFITDSDEVILNIRPTISRILRFVDTPNPTLAAAGIANPIPEIQVREMESVLRVSDGHIAVIGGLMQDAVGRSGAGLPGLQGGKGSGFLFGTQSRESDKTELVIFLRPRILHTASIDTSLQDFEKFLKPDIFSDQVGQH